MLAPHAIYCMGKALAHTEADFAYSDEALFRKTPAGAHVAHFKPDYAPEYLMSVNYICHLAVFRRSLFEAVGGERPECDGAQDHDLFLRLIDEMQRTDPKAKPLHLAQVLYYWRVHAASTSGGTGAKPYVLAAARKAAVSYTHLNLGRDLGPRCAARLHTGLTADCTHLDVDVEKYKEFLRTTSNIDVDNTKFEENTNLKMTRPAFGGHLMATILCPRFRPQM